MEILQLKYFSYAARTENFSHTAKHFMVPTSCISASIKKLENEIGIKLFDRTSNKIKLNEFGKILLKAIEKSDELFEKAMSDIYDLSQTEFGEIKLLVLTNREKVTKAISDFRIKHPNISFKIKHQEQPDHLYIKDYDVVVADENIVIENFDKSLWLHEQLYLAIPKDNILSVKNCIIADDLKFEKFICMPSGSSLRRCADNYFFQNNINPEIIIECDDPHYIRNYVKMGLGVSFFPSISWKEQIDKDVVLVKFKDGLFRDSFIYTNKSCSGLIRSFSQLLKSLK